MPFLIPLAGFVAGILLGFHLKGPLWGLVPILASLGGWLLLLKNASKPFTATLRNSRYPVCIALLFCGIGMLAAWSRQPYELQPDRLGKWIVAKGTVESGTPSASGDRYVVAVQAWADENAKATSCRNFNLLVMTRGYSATVGDIIEVSGIVRAVSDNPNYRPSGWAGRMHRQGILYSLSAADGKVRTVGHDGSVRAQAAAFRDRMVTLLEHSRIERPTVQFLAALLLGDKSLFLDETRRKFSNAGMAHVLALSGMHAGILMGIFLFILFPLKLVGLHKSRLWIAVGLLWAYAFTSGFAPSTVRASVMITFVAGALTLQRRNAAGNALLCSAFVILLFDPFAVYNVGMQLSFVCVASILAFASTLNTVDKRSHPFAHTVNSAVLVTLTASIATWVLVSYWFGVIPLLFLPANLVLLPLVPAFMWAGLAYVLLLGFGIDLAVLAYCLDASYNMLLRAMDFLSARGSATVPFGVQLPVVLVWLAGVLVIGFALRRRNRPGVWCGGALLVTALALVPTLTVKPRDGLIVQRQFSDLAVTLYDQGREIVATLPRHTVSTLTHKGLDLVSVDCKADVDSLLNVIAAHKKRKKKLLMIGSNAGKINIGKLMKYGDFDKIVVHSSVRRALEDEILSEVSGNAADSIHSIGREGPLNVELE